MRSVLIVLFILGLTFNGYGQNNNITISRTAFYYYDNTPTSTSSTLFPFNISYERKFTNGIALKAKFGWYRPYYGNENGGVDENSTSLMLERRFSNYSVGIKKYYHLNEQLNIYPTLNVTYRRGSETYLFRKGPIGSGEVEESIFKSASLNGFGVGVGLGVTYTILDTGIIGIEIMHREFTHNEGDSLLYEVSRYDNIGSKHQLSIELSVGITF